MMRSACELERARLGVVGIDDDSGHADGEVAEVELSPSANSSV